MPPLPTILNTFRCALNWSNLAGVNAVNVLHVGTIAGTVLGVKNALFANITSGMWGTVDNAMKIQSIDITPLGDNGATQRFVTDTNARWLGQVGGDMIPAAATLVLLRTELRGAAYRGRVFVPCVGESAQQDGTLLSTFVTPMQTAWETFRAAMLANATPLVVASYKNASANDVDSLSVESVCAIQKRRQAQLRR